MRSLTIERSAAIIVFALLFALATFIPIDADVWWHLRAGQHTLTHGMIYTDPFSFTQINLEWTNSSWGTQLILYGFWKIAGNFGLAIYTSVLATAGMWVVYRMSSGGVYLRAFALVIGAATAAVFWSPRPQMVSFLLSTIMLYILQQHKRRKVDRLWVIPIMMALWSNLHAGFSLGFVLLAGSIAGEIAGNIFNPKGEFVVPWSGVRKLVIVTLISLATACINPYGLKILAVPFQTITVGALQNYILEWNSPNFHERQVWPFAFLMLAVFGAAGASKKGLDWRDFVMVSGTFFLGLLAGRNISLFAVIATPVLTYHLNDALNERGWVVRPVQRVTPRMARLNAVLVGVILLGALAKVLLVLDPKTVDEAQRRFLPISAVEYLKAENPAGPMFNSYNWGGFLMFVLPDRPVFVDGRTDMYGDAFLSGVYIQTATGSAGWQDTLKRYGINLVVMEVDSGLARSLRDEPGWKLTYEDKLAAIFVREGANE